MIQLRCASLTLHMYRASSHTLTHQLNHLRRNPSRLPAGCRGVENVEATRQGQDWGLVVLILGVGVGGVVGGGVGRLGGWGWIYGMGGVKE